MDKLPLSELLYSMQRRAALKATKRNAEEHNYDHMYAAIDSGANVHTVKTKALLDPESVELSDITIGGLGADVDVSIKGTVAGTLRSSSGSRSSEDPHKSKKLKFRVTDSHVCEGSTVNLLSMSRLLDQDISFRFENNRP